MSEIIDFCSFTKNIGKNLITKNGQKILDQMEISATEAFKTTLTRAVQKTSGAIDDSKGNKIADKFGQVHKKPIKIPKKLKFNEKSVKISTISAIR